MPELNVIRHMEEPNTGATRFYVLLISVPSGWLYELAVTDFDFCNGLMILEEVLNERNIKYTVGKTTELIAERVLSQEF